MNGQQEFEKAWTAVQSLSEKFLENQAHYLSPNYQEAQVRQDFIDKLFSALGWDVGHNVQHDPYRQEVKIERPEKKSERPRRLFFLDCSIFSARTLFCGSKAPTAKYCN